MQISKPELRKRAKEIRAGLDMKSVSRRIVEKIESLEVFKSAEDVMIFYPLEDEVDLRELLRFDKRFYLPRVNGDRIECCRYDSNTMLCQGRFNITEPMGECVECPRLDLVFVPALAVDRDGNRLGYGGGFYDRFGMNEGKGAYKIVGIPKELVFDSIPNEEFDVAVDLVVTD